MWKSAPLRLVLIVALSFMTGPAFAQFYRVDVCTVLTADGTEYCSIPNSSLLVSPVDPPLTPLGGTALGDAVSHVGGGPYSRTGVDVGNRSTPPPSVTTVDLSLTLASWPSDMTTQTNAGVVTEAARSFSTAVAQEAAVIQAQAAAQRIQLPSINPSQAARQTQAFGPRAVSPENRAGVAPSDARPGDPVDPASGEFTHSRVNFEIVAFGPDVRFEQVYRSRWAHHGALGVGWTHSYEQEVVVSSLPCGATGRGAVQQAEWWDGRGNVIRFVQDGNAVWENRSGSRERILASSTDYIVQASEGTQLRFARNARVLDSSGAHTIHSPRSLT